MLVSQVSIYPLLLVLRTVLVGRNLTRPKARLTGDGPHVIYANHQSQLDALLLPVAFPPSDILRLLPFRFFVANAYFKNPVSATFLKLMGGFPAQYYPNRSYGLDHAMQLIGSNQTVVIFPQGMRTRERMAKPGIAVLAAEPGVRVIPIHIDWKSRFSCYVHAGTAITAGQAQPPDRLMEFVYSLPSQSA